MTPALDRNSHLGDLATGSWARGCGAPRLPLLARGETAADGPVLFRARSGDDRACEEAFAESIQGRRQFVCIPGEPGVGKTTLVHVFLQEVRRTSTARIGRGQCLENRGEVEPYIAVLEALRRLCREPDGDEVTSLLCSSLGARRGLLKCHGWPAPRLWRNSLKGTLASLAIACFANSPNSSKSWLSSTVRPLPR